VLSGFDTGLPGEAGAYAFTVGQGSAPGGMGYIFFLRLIYPLLAPTQARKVWHNVRVGLQLGRRAKLVIAEPIESFFEEPLESVRARLGLPTDPAKAGIVASGRSYFQDWMYPALRSEGPA
jgi:ubiquinone biosynthesis protein Coq4